jgi:hypothetical protein
MMLDLVFGRSAPIVNMGIRTPRHNGSLAPVTPHAQVT